MEYGKVLRRAWQITWRYKVLWLFGFLVALFAGQTNPGSSSRYAFDRGDLNAPQWALPALLLAILLALVLAVIGTILRYTGQAALIAMTQQIEETGNTTWRDGWRTGLRRFLHLLGIDLVLGVPLGIVAIILIAIATAPVLMFALGNQQVPGMAIALTVLLALGVIAILVVAGLAISLLSNLAYRACVLEQRGVIDSLRTGWRLLRARTGTWGLWWLLMVAINAGVGLVTLPIAASAAGIVAAAIAFSYRAGQSVLPAIVTALVFGLPLLLIGAAVRSVYETFLSVAWTLAYRELRPTEPGITA